jgi:hypothetical protein
VHSEIWNCDTALLDGEVHASTPVRNGHHTSASYLALQAEARRKLKRAASLNGDQC